MCETPDDDSPDDEPSDDLEKLLAELHRHLAATGELPVSREANLWLGEAEAVAGDLLGVPVSRKTVRKRVARVDDLLARVDGTENPDADDHLAEARALVERVHDVVQE